MSYHPDHFPPIDQWPTVHEPDCPTCQAATEVTYIGPATYADGTEVTTWHCRPCRTDWAIPVTHWPVLNGPDCPICQTPGTFWATIAADHHGDLWICPRDHEFVLTREGLIVLPEDAA
ncbi:hypothetical protein [Actinomadura rifamycini]|uniref:hypothetical protein n=1 Tax=Actinomadura rifamycini TaxID=31962 RepID=UPI0003FAB2EE|nr:hypothetical protein [Actinomadura rifamycini]